MFALHQSNINFAVGLKKKPPDGERGRFSPKEIEIMKSLKFTAKSVALAILTALIFVSAASDAFAGKGKSKQIQLWRQVKAGSLKNIENDTVRPEKYRVFRLDQQALKNSLIELPLENTEAVREKALIMEIPMPDGSLRAFRMEETKVLSPELAVNHPDWKTFIGYAVDDSLVGGRFDWNALGFHGYVTSEKGTIVIDPLTKGGTENYVVFYKHEFGKSDTGFYCRTERQVKSFIENNTDFSALPFAPEFSFGGTIRTYRLAVATTGEWTRNAGNFPTVTDPVQLRTNALAVIQTAVNRLNGIYLRELASQFQLVNPPVNNNATNIIFDDPATDPYDNTDSIGQLTINQTTVDNRVGAANYDIGHLFGTGGGGVASSPSLCSGQKAEGYSARGTNTGDPFVVDYVAHEIGHQFGANHTYNNADSSGACTTRNPSTAFEVASGATLMSYVGICNARNLQQYVDTGTPSFHIVSLTEIINNITTGDPATPGCGTASGVSSVPTVNAGAAYTIPRLTPFTLTATGSGALYSWEEYDLAPSASGEVGAPPGTYDIDNDGVLRPLFRPYSPVGDASRTFPSLTFILNPANNDASADVGGVRGNQPVLTYTGTHPTGFPGAVCEAGQTCVIGERLPTVSRTMNFRVSTRSGTGGVADAGTSVTIAAGAGPFQITTQNESPITWQAATMQTVTWDVAGTTANGINAANVNILLSTDGGQTFPVTLAANTPNDGTEQITVPNNPTSTARIRIEAVGNIFFDINNANFAITAPTSASVSVAGRVVTAKGRGIPNVAVTATDQNGVKYVARTNFFGYYHIADLSAGETYVLEAKHKLYRFSPRVLGAFDNIVGFNLIAER